MSDIFDEGKMMQVLGMCMPEGETLLAGIHGITLQVNKKKTSRFDSISGSRKDICWSLNVRSADT